MSAGAARGDGGAIASAALLRLIALEPPRRALAIRGLSPSQRAELAERWRGFEHDGQVAPEGDWRIWLIRAGRGFGKTRAGAEWLSELARRTPDGRFALVGGTVEDVRKVMIEGRSGLLAVARGHERVRWAREQGELRFPSGAVAHVYSAERPERLRGPEHHAAWCDEVAKWRNGDAAWDNLSLGLRLGDHPRVAVTTTPRPNRLMRRVMGARGVEQRVGRTRDNLALPAVFVAEMEAEYGGTRLGRQELDGEMLEDAEGALWSRALIEKCRTGSAPELARVVVGVDPPATAGGDACGIVAVGLGRDGVAYVLEDATVSGCTPKGWAQAVAACAARWSADRVVAERNQGGDMVESVLLAADAGLPVKPVHASRGKEARAEPVQILYEKGRVRHVGAFPALEDELCGLQMGGGYQGPGRSPDRADACVWAVTSLIGAKPRAGPAIRVF